MYSFEYVYIYVHVYKITGKDVQTCWLHLVFCLFFPLRLIFTFAV